MDWYLSIIRPRAVYVASLGLAIVWLLLIVAPPLLMANGRVTSAMAIYQGFSAICHQIPERTFHLPDGLPLAVCSRCTGIYIGALIGLLLYPACRPIATRVPPPRRLLIAGIVPLLIDFGANLTGLLHNTFLSRTVTGVVAGITAAFLILPGLVAAVDELKEPTATTESSSL